MQRDVSIGNHSNPFTARAVTVPVGGSKGLVNKITPSEFPDDFSCFSQSYLERLFRETVTTTCWHGCPCSLFFSILQTISRFYCVCKFSPSLYWSPLMTWFPSTIQQCSSRFIGKLHEAVTFSFEGLIWAEKCYLKCCLISGSKPHTPPQLFLPSGKPIINHTWR